MEALRQILKIPRDHELKIKIPQNILENETVEVILIIENRQEKFRHKINEMKKAVKDERFMDDLKNVSKDFEAVDSEGW
ncbi:MAG: hypothetical protein Q7J35_18745 [Candidatus Methanoperedens sp.]|nr:hypothetical protein [Candidatus Methanoperedens sp.]